MKETNIYKKLLEAKKEMQAIVKDSKNPFFKSSYFDINTLLKEVEPILQDKGLLLLQPIEAEWVKTIIYDVDSGDKVNSEMHLPELKDPQKLGSAITYYRRYTLQSLLGLQAEDDDGNKTNNLTEKKEKHTKVKLTKEGFNYLTTKATKDQIKEAIKTREMTGEQKIKLIELSK